jgi:AAA family ATP:ADP antiporter
MIQALQVIRQVSQYAIARPSREICFTVVPQADRYKTKNVIDTVVYRFGDLSAAWMETGLRVAGLRVMGSAVAGFGISVIWGMGALMLGKRFEILRARQQAHREAAPAAQV